MHNDDLRLGSIIEKFDRNKKYDIILIGFPYDEGCKINGGRIGSSNGPSEVRKLLYKMGTLNNPEYNIDISSLKIADMGDVETGLELEEAHLILEKTVGRALFTGAIPIIIGGSNDQSYSNAAAWLNLDKKSLEAVINIDAHLDVRPLKNNKKHSGSPFRLLLNDEKFCGKFIEFASQGSQCSKEHVDFILKKKKTYIHWFSKIKNAPKEFENFLNYNEKSVFLSFDIDSVRGSDCPGVSCPSNIGLCAQDALFICFNAGKSKQIGMFDISELNPLYDNLLSTKLVCNMIIYFLMGLCSK